jgi:small multidrug resistance pump
VPATVSLGCGRRVVVVVGYGLAFALLALALKNIDVGAAYTIWSGFGTVGAIIGGWLLFGERLNVAMIAGMALVVAGVAVMNLAGNVTHG